MAGYGVSSCVQKIYIAWFGIRDANGTNTEATSIRQHGAKIRRRKKIMKITRKGFTLVELLIVVAILGTLAASMMVSFGNSTAAAKAASIAANVDTCMTAAKIYYAENISTVQAATGDDDAGAIQGKIANYSKMSATGGTVTYTISGAGSNNWVVQVNFASAPDKEDIATALEKIPGYNLDADKTKIDGGNFTVNLLTGVITAVGG